MSQGRFDEAQRLSRARLQDLTAAAVADSLRIADALDQLVEVIWRGRGRLPVDAESLASRAIELREKLRGPLHLEVAAALANLGRIERQSRKTGAARAALERSLVIRRQLLTADDPNIAESLTALGLFENDVGSQERARALLQEALEIRQRRFGPDDVRVANSLNNLGICLSRMGQYGAAASALDGAVRIYGASARDSLNVNFGACLNTYAGILFYLSEFRTAQPVCERALRLWEAQASTMTLPIANAYENLAVAYTHLGRLDEARRHFDRAEAFYREHDPEGLARALSSDAELEVMQGHLGAARASLDTSVSIFEGHLGAHRSVAAVLNSQARVMMRQGDLPGARVVLSRSIHMLDSLLIGEHPDMAIALKDHAWCRWVEGDTAGVYEELVRADSISRNTVRLAAEVMTEREALRYEQTRIPTTSLLLSIATHIGLDALAARSFDAVIRSRALVLDEMAERRRVLFAAADTSLLRLADEQAAAGRQLAALLAQGPGSRPPRVYAEQVRMLRETRQRVEREVAARSASLRRDLRRASMGLRDVAATLAPDQALLAYVRYVRSDPTLLRRVVDSARAGSLDAFEAADAASKEEYAAFVLRGGESSPSLVPLGSARIIDSLVISWRERAGMYHDPNAPLTRALGVALRRHVWDPVAGRMSVYRLVFLVPDGTLQLMNPAALPAGRDGYLLERGPTFCLLSSERDLVPAEPAASERRGGLLALGGVDFDRSDGLPSTSLALSGSDQHPVGAVWRGPRTTCADLSRSRCLPLPSTRDEVLSIASVWRGRAAAHGRDTTATCLTGASASEEAFKAFAPRARVVHIATHGFFLSDRCLETFSGTAVRMNDALVEDPLLRSGLYLAGANRRGEASSGEDGVLTAAEVSTLDLGEVAWAVLSACDTGVGTVVGGEGVMGLRRAFAIAGARSLIMSLWKVDDAATRRWMQRAYEARWRDGLNTAEAGRTASLDLLREQRRSGRGSGAAAWGAFVVAGDWR